MSYSSMPIVVDKQPHYVPKEVADTLMELGWWVGGYTASGEALYRHPSRTEYFTWSEVVAIEMLGFLRSMRK